MLKASRQLFLYLTGTSAYFNPITYPFNMCSEPRYATYLKCFFSEDGFFPVPYNASSLSIAPLLQIQNLIVNKSVKTVVSLLSVLSKQWQVKFQKIGL